MTEAQSLLSSEDKMSISLPNWTPTPVAAIPEIVASAREVFDSGKTRPLAWRKAQLLAMRRMLAENRDAMYASILADLRRPATETLSSDILQIAGEVDLALSNLSEWTAPRPVSTPGFLLPGSSAHVPEPLGVILIIGTWNYPLAMVSAGTGRVCA
jgi:aldehyde dehydrogenase (NAD+)